jgi:hypothetical protein
MTRNPDGGHEHGSDLLSARVSLQGRAVCNASSPAFTGKPVNAPEGKGLDSLQLARQLATMSVSGRLPAYGHQMTRDEVVPLCHSSGCIGQAEQVLIAVDS